jgi:hypothetical protein
LTEGALIFLRDRLVTTGILREAECCDGIEREVGRGFGAGTGAVDIWRGAEGCDGIAREIGGRLEVETGGKTGGCIGGN